MFAINNRTKVLALTGLFAGFLFSDVSHNADFPITNLKIARLLEPADSNYYHHVRIAGCESKTGIVGYPELPCKVINLVIPVSEEVTGITIDDTISQGIGDTFIVYPSQPPRRIGDPEAVFVPPDSAAYSSGQPYPGELVQVVYTGYLSGYHLVSIALYPVQYTPVLKRLTFYTKIAFTVHTRAGSSQAVPVYRRSPIVQARIEKLVKSLVENPAEIDGLSLVLESESQEAKPLVITGLPSIEGSGVDYLIITNELLKPVFEPLAQWKTKKGVVTQIRTVAWIDNNYSGCDLQEKMRNFIRDAYSYWGVGYVLLSGDTRIVPERKVRNPEPWYNHYDRFMATDLYFSSLEGNWNFDGDYLFGEIGDSVDLFPDIAVGRAPVETVEEAEIFVNKVLGYEQNPVSDYLTKMLFMGIGEWSSAWWAEQAQLPYDPYTSPNGTGFPPWFSKYELYAPVVDTNLPIEWEGDAFLCKDRVIDAMNQGYHLMWHVDHSAEYVMGTGYNYNPEEQKLMSKTDANNLTNSNRPFILWTLGCDPNAFDYESISEAFMNNANGGAVAFIGNTIYGLFGDEWQGIYIFRGLFHENIYNLGDAFRGMQGIQYHPSYLPRNMFCAYNQNLLGDPEMMVWDSIPKDLIVSVPDTFWLPESIFTVVVRNLAPGETALVCVQKETEAYAVGTVGYPDTAVSFLYKPYRPGYIHITVTCHNYLVYEDSCYVPQYAGFAWLYPSSYFVFDDSLGTYGKVNGNKDGILNPGELVQLYLSIGNSGAHTGYYVTAKLRSQDTLISIRDSVVFYGHIAPGQVVHQDTLSGGYFSFYLKPNYPDTVLEYHRIDFEIFIESFRANKEKKSESRDPHEWCYSLILTVFCDSLGHSGHKTVSIPGKTYIYPQITNFGAGSARGVKAILRGQTVISIEDDSISVFGEIKSGETKYNAHDPFIISGLLSNLEIVMRDYYGREWIEPLKLARIRPPDSIWTNSYEGAIEVFWDWVKTPRPDKLAGYNLYRSETESGPYERINPVLIRAASRYYDTGLLGWKDYFYKITAVDTFGNESRFSKIVSQRTQPEFQSGFPVSVIEGAGGLGFYYSSPAVADLDNDGKDEIAIGAQGRVYLFDDNGTVMPGWPVDLGNYWISSSPALTDLNNDGRLEIIIGTGRWLWTTGDNMIHCFDMYGNYMPGWPVTLPSWVYASPVIADIDGDGQNEILATTMTGDAKLYAWEGDGSSVPGFPVTTDAHRIFESPVVADFDNDGTEEIFLQTSGSPTGTLSLLKYNPSLNKVDTMPGWPQLPGSALPFPASPTICDIDNDNTLEILVADRIHNRVRCYNFDGTLQWQFTNISNPLITSPTPGDINLDGKLEVIFVDDNGYVYALDNQSTLLWRTKTFDWVDGGTWARASQGIVIGNIDEDIYPEILFSCKDRLWILKADGTVMKGTPFRLEGDGHSTPAIADIDRDNDIEVICASGGDCRLRVWDLPTPYMQSEWPMFQHDIKNTGRYHQIDLVPPIATIISPLHGAYLNSQDSLTIFGTAKDLHFTDYRLKYYNPLTNEWFPVEPDSHSTVPVDSGLLGYWNTSALSGDYALCLLVADSSGNISADTIKVHILPLGATPPVVDPEFATFSSFPIDVATDGLNYVYVTDTGDDKIWKFSEQGDSLLVFGYDFNHPKGIAIDENGFIWVTDCLNHSVKLFDPCGTFVYKFGKHGNNPGEFKEPCGIAIDGNGNLWVCDNKNNRVQKFDNQGNFILQIPADTYKSTDIKADDDGSKLSLKRPTGISIQGKKVYVTDSKNDRVVVFDTAGNYLDIIGESERMKRPWDNQVDCFNNLFVADVHNNQIIQFNPWGHKLLAFGVKGSGPGQFKKPHGVALSTDGRYLYVCDTYNNRVQKFLLYFEAEKGVAGGPMASEEALLSRAYVLYQNCPNPFDKATVIKYQVASAGNNKPKTKISIKIYDVMGRLVKILVNEHKAPGVYEARWDGADEKGRLVSSGVYFYNLAAGNFTATKKMVVLR